MNRPEINVTPLIDVLLVLLIIFMVVTPMKPSSFDARIPSEPTRDPNVQSRPDTLIVAYVSDGAILINKEPTNATVVDTSNLSTRLQEIFHPRRKRQPRADRFHQSSDYARLRQRRKTD
jgi:biopolymer transport protein TolR